MTDLYADMTVTCSGYFTYLPTLRTFLYNSLSHKFLKIHTLGFVVILIELFSSRNI